MNKKNIFVIYTLGFMDQVGVSMLIPLLLNYFVSFGASLSFAGIISSTYAFIQFFSGPIMGRFSDIVGRKLCLQFSFFVSFLSYFMFSSTSSLYIMWLSRVPLGLFKHTHDLCKAYVADHASSTCKIEVFSWMNSISNIGFIIGPLCASFLLSLFNIPASQGHGIDRLAFITSVIFLFNFVLTTLLLDEVVITPQHEAKKTTSTYKQAFRGLLHLISEKNLGYFWFILFLRFMLSFSVFASRYKVYLILSPKELSIVVAAGALISTLTGFLVGCLSEMYNRQYSRMVQHAAFLQGLSIVGFTYYHNFVGILLFSLPFCFANAVLKASLTSMTLGVCSKRGLGMVMGIGTSVIATSRFLAPLLAGFISELVFYGPNIVGFSASFLAFFMMVTMCGTHQPYKRQC